MNLAGLQSFRKSTKGKVILYFLKLALSVLILWQIFKKVNILNALKDIVSLPVFIILLLISLSFIRHTLQFHNWYYSLQLNSKFQARKKSVISSYFVGQTLRFAIPGGPASFAKIFYVPNNSVVASLWSSIAEKSVMTWVTWSFAIIAGIFYYPKFPLWIWLILLLLLLFLPFLVKKGLGLSKKYASLKPLYAAQIPKVIAVQTFSTTLCFVQYWLILNCLLPINLWQTFTRMALTQFSNTIPITISGLGLREGFAIHFLAGAGFSAEQAVSTTLTLFFIHDVLPALIGIFFLLQGKKTKSPKKDIGKDIDEISPSPIKDLL